MLTHRGFSAWIVSNNEPINEYLVTVDEANHQVSCWIPGDEGRTFSVYWRDNGSGTDSCAFISLDGYVVPGRFLFGQGTTWRQGIRTGYTTERPFVFSRVDIATSQGTSQTSYNDVGMITLRIKRVVRVSETYANHFQRIPEPKAGSPESGDLCVGFGPDQPDYMQHPLTWRVKAFKEHENQPDQPSTWVSFAFRYRSRDFLITEGIATEAQLSMSTSGPREIQLRPASISPPPRTPSSATQSPSSDRKGKKKQRIGSGEPRAPSQGKRPQRVVSLQATQTQRAFSGTPITRQVVSGGQVTQTTQTGDAGGAATQTLSAQQDGQMTQAIPTGWTGTQFTSPGGQTIQAMGGGIAGTQSIKRQYGGQTMQGMPISAGFLGSQVVHLMQTARAGVQMSLDRQAGGSKDARLLYSSTLTDLNIGGSGDYELEE